MAVLFTLGTSLASIFFTSFAASAAQYARSNLDWEIVRTWAIFIAAGAFLSTFVATSTPAPILKVFISVLIALVAVFMLSDIQKLRAKSPPQRGRVRSVAFFGGIVAGMAGLGAGNVVVPPLVYFNIPVIKATAAASAVGVVLAFTGAIGYIVNGWNTTVPFSLGYVYLPALVPLAIASVIFAPLGVALAHRIDGSNLRKLFGCLMLAVSSVMIYTVFFS